MPEFYNPEVSFADPLISFTGLEKYKNNVDMLAGETPLGRFCFTDCGLTMHSIVETPTGLRTRWTLQFRFKLLPWAPLAQFTGVSEYTLDGQQRVLQQQDYWDSINLQPGGTYAPVSKLAALGDFVGQLQPGGGGAQQASDKELPYVLLRRAKDYEVRQYPQHVSVSTSYYRRIVRRPRLERTAHSAGRRVWLAHGACACSLAPRAASRTAPRAAPHTPPSRRRLPRSY